MLLYKQFFMLHSKKSILQVKIQRLRNNCRHVPSFKPFLRWKSKKKSKTGARWALEPWVFAHTSAMWWWKLLQNSWAGKLAMLCRHVVCMVAVVCIWLENAPKKYGGAHVAQRGATIAAFGWPISWCKQILQPHCPRGLSKRSYVFPSQNRPNYRPKTGGPRNKAEISSSGRMARCRVGQGGCGRNVRRIVSPSTVRRCPTTPGLSQSIIS